jgi:hypothetical protein
MTDLRYPAFPVRALLAACAALIALMAVAVIVNRSGPSVGACKRAAERVMVARDYSAEAMELAGQRSVPACRGVSAGQYVQAVLDAYRTEYWRPLARSPADEAIPPPSYKARSAGSEFSSRPQAARRRSRPRSPWLRSSPG